MLKVLLLCLIYLLLSEAKKFEHYDGRVINMTWSSNPHFVDLSLKLKECKYTDANVTIFRNVNNPSMRLQVTFTLNGRADVIFNKTAGICKLIKSANPLVNALLWMARTSVRFLLKCPVTPGRHTINHIEFPEEMVPLGLFYHANGTYLSHVEFFEGISPKSRTLVATIRVLSHVKKVVKFV